MADEYYAKQVQSHRLCQFWAAALGGSHYDCQKVYTCGFLLLFYLHLSPTAAVNDQHLNVQCECVVWSCFKFREYLSC